MFYYIDDIININGLDLDNTLLDEKSYENVLIMIMQNSIRCKGFTHYF